MPGGFPGRQMPKGLKPTATAGLSFLTSLYNDSMNSLMFARRQVLRPETVNLNRLLLDSQDVFRQALGAGIALELLLDPAVHPTLLDIGQFDAAILNLVMNARDAMPEGGRLSISTQNVAIDAAQVASGEEKPGDYAVVSVRDTGTGIPPAILGRVFEPFFTTKGVGKGSGLGLSQVYGFVKESGGHTRVDSAPGGGSTVAIYLPRAAERAGAVTGAAQCLVPPWRSRA